MKLDHLAVEHADIVDKRNRVVHRGDVRIVAIEYTEGRDLCQELGIQRLPTVHLYAANGQGVMEKVQDFPCPPKEFFRLQDYTKGYLKQQQKRLGDDEKKKDAFETKLDKGRDMIQRAVTAETLLAAADHVYGNGSSNPHNQNLRRGFWSRFRRDNKQGEDVGI
jgi:hypothetical protein